MPRKMLLTYGIRIDKRFFGWEFGIGLSGSGCETYIYINLFKRYICIGKILKSTKRTDQHNQKADNKEIAL